MKFDVTVDEGDLSRILAEAGLSPELRRHLSTRDAFLLLEQEAFAISQAEMAARLGDEDPGRANAAAAALPAHQQRRGILLDSVVRKLREQVPAAAYVTADAEVPPAEVPPAEVPA